MKRARFAAGVVKGGAGGFALSLFIHAGALLLAGVLVVFNVVQKEEKKFIPPRPVDRPKMKLKKPKVKVKKTARPKSTTRIVTKVQKAGMPDIQLPEMSGISAGLAGGIGGFELLPDPGELTLMGTRNSVGSDLEGTFYDLNRTRSGSATGIDVTSWRAEFRKFLTSGWKTSVLNKYYRHPRKLYASSLVYPPALSSIAPSAFGDRDASGAYWMVHYKGQIVHREGITFRFWVTSDENLAVRINGEYVIASTWRNAETGEPATNPNPVEGLWETSDMMKSYRYWMGNNTAVVGDWITLEPGVPVDMEMVIGDNGGQACFILAVEEQGVEYPKTRQGGPLLPAFKTAAFSRDMIDLIYKNLVDDEISLTTGPVFNDYGSSQSAAENTAETVEPAIEPAAAEPNNAEPDSKVWQLVSGKSFEARLVTVIGDKAVFETAKRRQVKVPVDQLSDDALREIELSCPPKLNIDLIKDIHTKTFAMDHISTSSGIRPPEKRGRFGVRLSQASAGKYDHQLFVDCYVVGQERLGQQYILLDRCSTSFNPAEADRRTHTFRSEREVVLENFDVDLEPRGETYAAHLITVADERGEIIAVSAPAKWLYEYLENLKKLQPGNYMNKKCERVYPTRPPKTRY